MAMGYTILDMEYIMGIDIRGQVTISLATQAQPPGRLLPVRLD